MSKRLLERARREGHPIIDGDRVTFLWQGDSAPHLIDDLHGWTILPNPCAASFDLARVYRYSRKASWYTPK